LVGARHKPSPVRKHLVPGNAQRLPLAANFPRAFRLQFEILNFKFEIHFRRIRPATLRARPRTSPELRSGLPSGIILTEAPSIVETTHTKQRKGGCDASAIGDSAHLSNSEPAPDFSDAHSSRQRGQRSKADAKGWVFSGSSDGLRRADRRWRYDDLNKSGRHVVHEA